MKLKHVLICFICIIICLTSSCGVGSPDQKESDPEFQERFTSDYWPAESNLMYASASVVTTSIIIESNQSGQTITGVCQMADIHKVQDRQHVAIIEKASLLGGEVRYSLAVFSTGEKKPSLLTWSVKSVSVLAIHANDFATVNLHGSSDQIKQEAQRFSTDPLKYHMERGALEIAMINKQEHAEQIESIISAYQDKKIGDQIAAHELSASPGESDQRMACYLLVRFEETDAMIWVAQLYQDIDGDNLYFACSDPHSPNATYLARIEPQLAQSIRESLDK